jgi:RNA methyltransferase, TrmH family
MTEIHSLQHPLVKHLVKLRSDRRYRQQQKRFILCGATLATEAAAHCRPSTLLSLSLDEVPPEIGADRVITVTPQIISKIAGVTTDEKLLVEVALPPPRDLSAVSRLLILDAVQDPGNLGTLLRTAAAFGWEGVLLLPGCADPFNDKVVRAARAVMLWLPYNFCTLDQCLALLDEQKFTSAVAHVRGRSFEEVALREKIALVLGNESRGPSPEFLAHCAPIAIPTSSAVESLNVAAAGAILMHAWASPKIGRIRP